MHSGNERRWKRCCRAQESDRTSPFAPTSNQIRSGTVLPGGSRPKPQATGSLPRPTNSTVGSHHLEREGKKNSPHLHHTAGDRCCNYGFFNTHVSVENLGSPRHFWSLLVCGYRFLVFFRSGSCSCNLRGWLTAKESHQPLQVLRRGRQVELFAHEAHPAQPESA